MRIILVAAIALLLSGCLEADLPDEQPVDGATDAETAEPRTWSEFLEGDFAGVAGQWSSGAWSQEFEVPYGSDAVIELVASNLFQQIHLELEGPDGSIIAELGGMGVQRIHKAELELGPGTHVAHVTADPVSVGGWWVSAEGVEILD